MRKSTIAMAVILALAGASLAWMLGWITDLVRPELDASSEWTRTYGDALAPKATVGVTRVPGGADRPTADRAKHGLFVTLRLSDATWSKPGAAEAVGLGIARAAFERYGPDRPIEWVQTKLLRADGSLGREIAFARGEGGVAVPVPYREGERPAAGTPPPPAGPRGGEDAPRPPSVR